MPKLPQGPHDGLETDPPSSAVRASPEIVAEADRIMDDLFDREPPTSRQPPRPLSRLAVTLEDCVFLMSLEDADDRDLSGRETITFLVLSAEEIEGARLTVGDALSAAAAHIIGRLPRRKP